ncbi:MAG: TolC family protein, partial [Cyanobacteria bacterium REEB67]|nr:TolC family protein [Cyanobacteria bacterium REEB67]
IAVKLMHLKSSRKTISLISALSFCAFSSGPARAGDVPALIRTNDPAAKTSKILAYAQSETPLRGQTIEQAEILALSTDPTIREAHWQQQLVSARLSESRLKRLPTLKVLDVYAYSNSPFYVFGSLLQQNKIKQSDLTNLHSLNHPKPISNFIGSAYFVLPIFNQLQTSTQIAMEKLAAKQVSRQQDRTAQEMRFRLIKAFFGVLLADSRMNTSIESVKSARAELKRVSDLRDTGKVVESDVLAMELQLAQFKQEETAAEGALNVAYAEFNSLIGNPITLPVKLAGQLVDQSWSVEQESILVDKAIDIRPDLESVRLQIGREHQEIKKAKGKYLPNVKAFGGTILSGQGVVNATPNFAVGGMVSWDVDPSRPAVVKQAKANEQIAKARCDEKINLVKLEVVRAFQQFRVAADSKAVAFAAVAKAKENLRIVRNRYEVGLTTVTDLIQAQTLFAQAQNGYMSAVYDNYVGYANLLLSVGQLNDVKSFEG